MTEPTKVIVRRVCADDSLLSRLADFRCADQNADHEIEVERWIQDQLASWAFDPGAARDEPQVLAALDDQTEALIGLFAHEHAVMQVGDVIIPAEKIAVVAVGLDYQRQRDVDNRRYSDIVMSSGLQAIERRTPPQRRVFGYAHIDNGGSFRLLERHSMARRIPIDAMTQLVTHG
ncbi:hypothetical protein [Aeromicrobium duanguangcaii]|uniref:GNAT family N-acetyltransferase n=1 Tax=Aeromicrobium duanguangcaii TaxID=2968086 RepID=A0ABY5KIG3_9ACTN|nr:hypothetical protein [Aeromicrobium duanguangcaii]MCD9153327.1 hypothetical protein [Aeromicrobium duanguangcaii]UUI69579.1 hypothetical protein NP095_05645 [Aeromicrobium duanguangcaii]